MAKEEQEANANATTAAAAAKQNTLRGSIEFNLGVKIKSIFWHETFIVKLKILKRKKMD